MRTCIKPGTANIKRLLKHTDQRKTQEVRVTRSANEYSSSSLQTGRELQLQTNGIRQRGAENRMQNLVPTIILTAASKMFLSINVREKITPFVSFFH